MSNADLRTARQLGITAAAFAEYRDAGAPLEQPAAFVLWLRDNHQRNLGHAQIKQAA